MSLIVDPVLRDSLSSSVICLSSKCSVLPLLLLFNLKQICNIRNVETFSTRTIGQELGYCKWSFEGVSWVYMYD